MALKFGTSGLRGLVTEFTDQAIDSYISAFLIYCERKEIKKKIILAGDLRDSTPDILSRIQTIVHLRGFDSYYGGFVPTPALAYACKENLCAGLMITGSHIPSDRNGIKFYLPDGEILKNDEVEILKLTGCKVDSLPTIRGESREINLAEMYIQRYFNFWRNKPLSGLRILFYEHSTVAKTVLKEIFQNLGAEVDCAFESKTFVAVDTEALDSNPALEALASSGRYFATISADGDGDRPLVINEKGNVIRGDVLCMLAARYIGDPVIVTPISSNSSVEKLFSKVHFTKIGSPYVIEEMIKHSGLVVGFEANGGFLLGSDWCLDGEVLRALPTRDAVLPALLVILAAHISQLSLSELVGQLSGRQTYSDLIRGVQSTASQNIIEHFDSLISVCGKKVALKNKLDGLRLTLVDGEIVHFRPSGNAPEFRIYVEAASSEICFELCKKARAEVLSLLG